MTAKDKLEDTQELGSKPATPSWLCILGQVKVPSNAQFSHMENGHSVTYSISPIPHKAREGIKQGSWVEGGVNC